MSELVPPVKGLIQAIAQGIKLANRLSESASSADASKALQIFESAPSLQKSLERSSQAIRDAYRQNVEAHGEPFTKALVEDRAIQNRLKDLKNDVRDCIDECQDFEDEPNLFDVGAFTNIQEHVYRCSIDCISIFKDLRDRLAGSSLRESPLDDDLRDDRAQLSSMRQQMDLSQRVPEPSPSYDSLTTPTEALRISAPSIHAPPSEPVKPRSPWEFGNTEFDLGPTLSGSLGVSLRRSPVQDSLSTAPLEGPRLIPKEIVHSRINANEEFLERRRQSRLTFNNELRHSAVSSISENRVSDVFSEGPFSPLSASPGTSTSPVEGRSFRASLNGYDLHMTRQISQGQASYTTRSSVASSIHDRRSPVERHDSDGSIFGLRVAAPASPVIENLAAGTSGNIELWTPIMTTASPLVIENPHTWDPRATPNLQIPAIRGDVVSGLEPVSNLNFDDEKIAVNEPEQTTPQSTATFSVRSMDYPIRPDSSFSHHGGFCEGAKAILRGESGFKVVKRPGGQYKMTLSAKCVGSGCSFEVDWNDVEKDRLLDRTGIYGNSGLRFRQRFITKCHLKADSIGSSKYACPFCIQVHTTVEEHDATIFYSVGQLFKHIAKHPQPVPNVNGIRVLYGFQAPTVVDFDIHFTSPQPLVPEFAYAAIAQKIANRPSGQTIASNHPKKDSRDFRDPDGAPVLQFAVGARILGISFPDRFHGNWCMGYHDGGRGAFPASMITLDLPGRSDEVLNTQSKLIAYAKWDFKLKSTKDTRWLKFKKGETISHIGFRYQDQWCWTGQNASGQWGLFPNAFVDSLHEEGLFSTSPGSIKKSRMPSFPLGRHKSSVKHERKTSIMSTSSGGSIHTVNTMVQPQQPGLEVASSPSSSRFHFLGSNER